MEQAERRPFCGALGDRVLRLLDKEWCQYLSTPSSDLEPATKSHKPAQHLVRPGYRCMKQKMKDHVKIILFKHIT